MEINQRIRLKSNRTLIGKIIEIDYQENEITGIVIKLEKPIHANGLQRIYVLPNQIEKVGE